MNNPTCAQCDCVAGCQASPELFPHLLAQCIASGQVSAAQIEAHVRAGDLVDGSQPDVTFIDGGGKAVARPVQPVQPAIDPKCPICDCPPVFSLDVRVNEWEGVCKRCDVSGQSAATQAEAMRKWAVRHPKPAIAQPKETK